MLRNFTWACSIVTKKIDGWFFFLLPPVPPASLFGLMRGEAEETAPAAHPLALALALPQSAVGLPGADVWVVSLECDGERPAVGLGGKPGTV